MIMNQKILLTKAKFLLIAIIIVTLPLTLIAYSSSEVELIFTYFNPEPTVRAMNAAGDSITLCGSEVAGEALGLSPNGEMLAVVRYNLNSEPPRLDGTGKTSTLSLINLRTCESTVVFEEPAAAVAVIWSPDSRHLLIHKLVAIAPLSAGYNYGYLSVYDLENNSIVEVEENFVFGLNWFPDNQSILLWNETDGYMRYSVDDRSLTSVSLPDARDFVIYNIDMALNLVAYTTDVGINVYDLEHEELVGQLQFSDLDGLPASELWWSPDGRLLMIEQQDNHIVVWDFERNEILSSFNSPALVNPRGYRYQLAWSPNSDAVYIVVYRTDDSVDIYKGIVETGEFVQFLHLS